MSPASPAHITMLGCGNMGGALLKSWINAPEIKAQFSIIKPSAPSINSVEYFPSPLNAKQSLQKTDLLIIAVKPQMIKDALTPALPFIKEQTTLLSIAAGTSIATLEKFFEHNQPIIRTMPNTPSAIGKGITALMTNPYVSEPHKKLAEQLAKTAGEYIWLEDESLFDPVTALAGSGPAYLFHMIEIMSHAGENIGLPQELAVKLARQTIIGASALAEQENELSAGTLRQNVTSPGGTTAAALNILMDGRWQEIFNEALEAAKQRSIELSK
ncbi:MAG: pyrroline-5-carboxylate reductase [Micavibrio sp.]|nr:pyrroline-5-carboxylate reductase [Micavibrio sp.]